MLERRPTRWAVFVSCLAVALTASLLTGCQQPKTPPPTPVPVETWSFKFVKSYPHNRTDYTQGLIFREGDLYESTGQYRESKLRRVRIEDGASLKKINLESNLFGEGLAEFGGKLYQLTWRAGDCIVYDMASLKPIDHFKYEGEGWGLTHDGSHFIMSDGSHTLQYRDTNTFEVVKTVEVFHRDRRLRNLNELEFVDGLLFANVYQTETIVAIDPAKGAVIATIDCKEWVARARRLHKGIEVLNGIAHNPDSGHFYITGKDWPILFEMELIRSNDK